MPARKRYHDEAERAEAAKRSRHKYKAKQRDELFDLRKQVFDLSGKLERLRQPSTSVQPALVAHRSSAGGLSFTIAPRQAPASYMRRVQNERASLARSQETNTRLRQQVRDVYWLQVQLSGTLKLAEHVCGFGIVPETNEGSTAHKEARVENEQEEVVQDEARAESEQAEAVQDEARVESEQAEVVQDEARAESEQAEAVQDEARAESEQAEPTHKAAPAESEQAEPTHKAAPAEGEQVESDRPLPGGADEGEGGHRSDPDNEVGSGTSNDQDDDKSASSRSPATESAS